MLDAEVELVSTSGMRRIPLQDFIVGNRKTLRRPDEILAAVIVPRRLDDARSTFLKLGVRRYLVISIAMVAAVVKSDETGRVAEARVAVGSCSVRAQRLIDLERDLVGAQAAEGLGAWLCRSIWQAFSNRRRASHRRLPQRCGADAGGTRARGLRGRCLTWWQLLPFCVMCMRPSPSR